MAATVAGVNTTTAWQRELLPDLAAEFVELTS
jgi:hypothetical protein